jgi:2-polyprenyl-3-methyl-5-hydroxy-6-metoxy-1,4-benzoquinol methylase
MPLDLIKLEMVTRSWTTNQIDKLHTYINEASFMYSLIEEDIDVPPMSFYEIGSGIGLLSRMIAEKGHTVIATEPATSGFDAVGAIAKVIEECYISNSKVPVFYSGTAEELFPDLGKLINKFDYIFCANVVEHVRDLSKYFNSILPLISQKGKFRFICPNYAIPYEPHFGFITLFSKQATLKVRSKQIQNSRISNPIDFYNDLTFPTVWKIKRFLKDKAFMINFNEAATLKYIDRAINDTYFRARKENISRFAGYLRKPLVKIIRFTPVYVLPIIDACIIPLRIKSE